MGRLIACRYVVEGEFVADTAIHVGGALGDLVSDMPLARDGADRFYLPGTSLAGPIRRWWRRHGREKADTVFGWTPEGDADGDEGHASYLIVDDARARGEPSWETRDGVGIDRETGGAAEGIKYDRELLPKGTRFDFRMEIDLGAGVASVVPPTSTKLPPVPAEDATLESVGALIVALENGRIRFGAAKTRGLGRLRLEGTRVARHDLGRSAGMLARLKGETGASAAQRDGLVEMAHEAGAHVGGGEVEIVLTWSAELPVMNKSDVEGVSIDALPLVTAVGDRLQPVITGASLKGVWRAHGERICRTLRGARPGDGAPQDNSRRSLRQEFLDDLAECELVEAVFGARGKGGIEDESYGKESNDAGQGTRAPLMPGLGALSVDDCLIDRPIARAQWRDLLAVAHDADKEEKTGAVRRSLDATGTWGGFRAATHVAIDRWTGGAAESLLFSRIEPGTDGARTFHLWLDPARIAPRLPADRRYGTAEPGGLSAEKLERFRHAAFGLLVVILRDARRGRIPVGFATTRGLGSIRLDRIVLRAAASDLGALGVAIDAAAADAETGAVEIELALDDAVAMQRLNAVDAAWGDYWRRHGAEGAA